MRLPVPQVQDMLTLVCKVAQGPTCCSTSAFRAAAIRRRARPLVSSSGDCVSSSVCPSALFVESLNVAYLFRGRHCRSWVLPTPRIRCFLGRVNPQVLTTPSPPRSEPSRVGMGGNRWFWPDSHRCDNRKSATRCRAGARFESDAHCGSSA